MDFENEILKNLNELVKNSKTCLSGYVQGGTLGSKVTVSLDESYKGKNFLKDVVLGPGCNLPGKVLCFLINNDEWLSVGESVSLSTTIQEQVLKTRRYRHQENARGELAILYSRWSEEDEIVSCNSSETSYTLIENNYCFPLCDNIGEYASLSDCINDKPKKDPDNLLNPKDSNTVTLYYRANSEPSMKNQFCYTDFNTGIMDINPKFGIVPSEDISTSRFTQNLILPLNLNAAIGYWGLTKWHGAIDRNPSKNNEIYFESNDKDFQLERYNTDLEMKVEVGSKLYTVNSHCVEPGTPNTSSYFALESGKGFYVYGGIARKPYLFLVIRASFDDIGLVQELLNKISNYWLDNTPFTLVAAYNPYGDFSPGDGSPPPPNPNLDRSLLSFFGRKEKVFVRFKNKEKELPISFRCHSNTDIPSLNGKGIYGKSSGAFDGISKGLNLAKAVPFWSLSEHFFGHISSDRTFIYVDIPFGAYYPGNQKIFFTNIQSFKLSKATLEIVESNSYSRPNLPSDSKFWYREISNPYLSWSGKEYSSFAPTGNFSSSDYFTSFGFPNLTVYDKPYFLVFHKPKTTWSAIEIKAYNLSKIPSNYNNFLSWKNNLTGFYAEAIISKFSKSNFNLNQPTTIADNKNNSNFVSLPNLSFYPFLFYNQQSFYDSSNLTNINQRFAFSEDIVKFKINNQTVSITGLNLEERIFEFNSTSLPFWTKLKYNNFNHPGEARVAGKILGVSPLSK